MPAAWTAIVLGGGSAGLLAVVCYLLRQPLVGIFTKDPQVIANAQQIFYVMCFTIFTDGVNVSIEGACHQSTSLDRLAFAVDHHVWQLCACSYTAIRVDDGMT